MIMAKWNSNNFFNRDNPGSILTIILNIFVWLCVTTCAATFNWHTDSVHCAHIDNTTYECIALWLVDHKTSTNLHQDNNNNKYKKHSKQRETEYSNEARKIPEKSINKRIDQVSGAWYKWLLNASTWNMYM